MLLWPLLIFLLQTSEKAKPQFIRLTPHPTLMKRGYWEVDPFFFEGIKRDLKPYLQKRFRAEHPFLKNYDRYRFQVVGYPTSQSPHFVLVSAFCSDPVSDPASSLVLVADGGYCYYFLFYSLKSQSFIIFSP